MSSRGPFGPQPSSGSGMGPTLSCRNRNIWHILLPHWPSPTQTRERCFLHFCGCSTLPTSRSAALLLHPWMFLLGDLMGFPRFSGCWDLFCRLPDGKHHDQVHPFTSFCHLVSPPFSRSLVSLFLLSVSGPFCFPKPGFLCKSIPSAAQAESSRRAAMSAKHGQSLWYRQHLLLRAMKMTSCEVYIFLHEQKKPSSQSCWLGKSGTWQKNALKAMLWLLDLLLLGTWGSRLALGWCFSSRGNLPFGLSKEISPCYETWLGTARLCPLTAETGGFVSLAWRWLGYKKSEIKNSSSAVWTSGKLFLIAIIRQEVGHGLNAMIRHQEED